MRNVTDFELLGAHLISESSLITRNKLKVEFIVVVRKDEQDKCENQSIMTQEAFSYRTVSNILHFTEQYNTVANQSGDV